MNLDCMENEELVAFWAKYMEGGSLLDEAGQKLSRDTVENLACYAINKACAKDLRRKGEIARALAYEKMCDIIYNALPEAARW